MVLKILPHFFEARHFEKYFQLISNTIHSYSTCVFCCNFFTQEKNVQHLTFLRFILQKHTMLYTIGNFFVNISGREIIGLRRVATRPLQDPVGEARADKEIHEEKKMVHPNLTIE